MLLFFSTLEGYELVPIPAKVKVDKAKALLGKKLFTDPILSKNKKISCFSCHNLKTNGADTVAYTQGIDGRQAQFNTPTVYNAVYNFRQFWDGRSKNLKSQALDPIENPREMGNTVAQVLKDLKANHTYVRAFYAIYQEGISRANLADALSEFGKALITPHSKFDQYLRGDKNALSKKAIIGYKLFKDKGCISCHNGINIGGNLYNKFGIYADTKSKELGRYMITKKEEDKFVFKVPSLRNVALTAPYMHDGRASSLKEAVNIMSRHQLGRPMMPDELEYIVEFLKSLTGQLPDIVKDIHVLSK
jgi:cytochrome c peroxidase